MTQVLCYHLDFRVVLTCLTPGRQRSKVIEKQHIYDGSIVLPEVIGLSHRQLLYNREKQGFKW